METDEGTQDGHGVNEGNFTVWLYKPLSLKKNNFKFQGYSRLVFLQVTHCLCKSISNDNH